MAGSNELPLGVMSVPPCAERREGRRSMQITLSALWLLPPALSRALPWRRAFKLPMTPSLSMDTKHGVVRRRDHGVLDMTAPHRQRGNGGH
jgi:hypothetical protein